MISNNGAQDAAQRMRNQGAQLKDEAMERGEDLAQRARVAAGGIKDELTETGRRAREALAEGMERAESGYEDAKENLGEVMSDLMEQASAMTDKLAGYVRAYPGRSFAAAVAIGFVASRLLRKKGSR